VYELCVCVLDLNCKVRNWICVCVDIVDGCAECVVVDGGHVKNS
jgi:hypothetical protein